MGIPDHITCLLTTCMQVKKQQSESDMEQQTSSKLGNGYIKAVYCHPAYLTYMKSTSYEMLGWMNHKLESRLPEKIPTTSDMQMEETEEELKNLSMKVKEESKKSCLKTQHSKNKDLDIRFYHFMANGWGKSRNSVISFSCAPKSMHTVTAAMKLKRCLLLGRIAMTNLDGVSKSRDTTLPTKSIYSKLWFF